MTRASSLLPGDHLPRTSSSGVSSGSSTARVTTPRSTEVGAPEPAVGAAVSRLATHGLLVGRSGLSLRSVSPARAERPAGPNDRRLESAALRP
jgi:hypothetical protein